MAIIVEQIDKSGHVLRLDKLEHNTVTLGRGFDNDIVLTDPTVDAHHCVLSWEEEAGQLRIQDLGALNGLWALDNKQRKSRVLAVSNLQSGHTLLVGKTLVRIYHSSHPVPAAKPAQLDEFITGFFGHFLVVVVLAAIAIALDLWNQYLDHPTGQHYAAFGREALYGVIGVAVYSGFWAILGKNLLQDGRFWFHLSLSFLVLSLWMGWESFTPWAMFNLQIPVVPALWISKIFSGILVGGAIYTSCLYATRLGLKSRLAIAAILPLVIITPLITKLFDKRDFSSRPDYSHVLVAPESQWRSPEPVAEFMSKAEAAYATYDEAADADGTEDADEAEEADAAAAIGGNNPEVKNDSEDSDNKAGPEKPTGP